MAFSDALKQSVRKRALGRCCICQEPFVDIHHIIPQAEGGPDSDANAAPLCPNCHRRYGDNERHRNTILEFRDNWYDKVANAPIEVKLFLEIFDQEPRLKTFNDFEQHILELSVDKPMAAYLQLYEMIAEQLRINGRAMGMERTENWSVRVASKMLERKNFDPPHEAVSKMYLILENYAELYDKTIMPEDDDPPISDHDIMQNIALGLKFPRMIRDTLRYVDFEGRPEVWPVRKNSLTE